MSILIANNVPRKEYTVGQGVEQKVFAVTFEFFNDAEVNIYVDGVLKTQGSGEGEYQLSGGDGSTGTATFNDVTTGTQPVTGAAGGSTVVVVRDIPIQRVTDFTAGAAINRAALNEQLDIVTALVADLNDRVSRSLELNDYEVASSTTLPTVDNRKGKYLSFNATTGAPEAGPDTDNVNTLAGITDAINTLANLENGTVATTGLSRLAAVDTDIDALANITQEIIDCAAGLIGTTPITRGGTGATTAAQAKINLGITDGITLQQASDEALALAIALG